MNTLKSTIVLDSLCGCGSKKDFWSPVLGKKTLSPPPPTPKPDCVFESSLCLVWDISIALLGEMSSLSLIMLPRIFS